MKFEFKEHTDKGLVREVNEDNLGHSLGTRNGDIFVVCDGMGGHVGGKTASTIGVNAIMSELSQKEHSNLHVAISQSLVFANEQVLGHAASEPSLKGMGSTATVCLIKDDLLYVGHVGDSRAYIFSDGKLYRITRDDSFVQQLVDSGAITEDEAESHPQKNRILQALGSTSALSPRIPNKPFKLKKGDLLMLCSDGLTSMVVDELIEQVINPDNLAGTLNDLHRYAMNNGGKDNITITLIKVTSSIHSSSEFDHYTKKYPQKVGRDEDPEPPVIPIEPAKKKQPLTLMIGAAAAVILIAVGVIYWKNSSDDKPTDVSLTENTSGKDNENTKDNGLAQPFMDETANNNGDNKPNGKRQGKDEKPPVNTEDKPTDDATKIKALEKQIADLGADLRTTNDKINKLIDKRNAAGESGDRDMEQAHENEITKLINEERKPAEAKLKEKNKELKALKAKQEPDDNKPN
jgi:serine/threonine protein phosphatase PrpC